MMSFDRAQLFDGFRGSLPVLAVGESLYSWCARFHQLNVGFDARGTSRLLFGHPTAGLAPDVPCGLRVFDRVTRSALGSLDQVLDRQTVFKFYARFVSLDCAQKARDQLLGHRLAVARALLGIRYANYYGLLRLKYCPRCLAEQLQATGYTWWQTVHQLPTAFMCVIHNEWLRYDEVASGPGLGFQLPRIEQVEAAFEGLCPLGSSGDVLSKLTQWGQQIWRDGSLQMNDLLLRWCYLLQAKRNGWISGDGYLRLPDLQDAFMAHYSAVLDCFSRELLGNLEYGCGGFVAQLLKRTSRKAFALRHALMMNFMFDGFDEFVGVFDSVLALLAMDGELGCEEAICGSSVKRDPPAVLDRAQTSYILAKFQSSIETPQTPHKPQAHWVAGAKELALYRLLPKGLSRVDMVKAANVSLFFLRAYFNKFPEQKMRWEVAFKLRRRNEYRRKFLKVLRVSSNMPVSKIKAIEGSGYKWLCVNDREWLSKVLPAMWKIWRP